MYVSHFEIDSYFRRNIKKGVWATAGIYKPELYWKDPCHLSVWHASPVVKPHDPSFRQIVCSISYKLIKLYLWYVPRKCRRTLSNVFVGLVNCIFEYEHDILSVVGNEMYYAWKINCCLTPKKQFSTRWWQDQVTVWWESCSDFDIIKQLLPT